MITAFSSTALSSAALNTDDLELLWNPEALPSANVCVLRVPRLIDYILAGLLDKSEAIDLVRPHFHVDSRDWLIRVHLNPVNIITSGSRGVEHRCSNLICENKLDPREGAILSSFIPDFAKFDFLVDRKLFYLLPLRIDAIPSASFVTKFDHVVLRNSWSPFPEFASQPIIEVLMSFYSEPGVQAEQV